MRTFGLILLVLVVAIGVGAYFLLSNVSGIVKSGVEKYGSEAAQAPVAVETVDLSSLLLGQGAVRGFSVGNPAGFSTPSALEFSAVSVKLDPQSVLGDGPIHIKEVVVDSPKVTYEQGPGGSNLDALQRNIESYQGPGTQEAAAPSAGEEKPARKVIIDNLYIRNGQIAISDSRLMGQSLSVPLPPIHLTDIGKAKGGATSAEVAEKVMEVLSTSTAGAATGALQDALGKLSVDAVSTDAVTNTGKKLKGLFGK